MDFYCTMLFPNEYQKTYILRNDTLKRQNVDKSHNIKEDEGIIISRSYNLRKRPFIYKLNFLSQMLLLMEDFIWEAYGLYPWMSENVGISRIYLLV